MRIFNFCFNDCIPRKNLNSDLVKHLSNNLKYYIRIKNKFPDLIDGIITDRSPNRILLNEQNFSLTDCINHLDRDDKIIALRSFGKYPIDDLLGQIDLESLLQDKYIFTINSEKIDATNAKIVFDNSGILFTLPVVKELEKNKILIQDKLEIKTEIINHFGSDSNADFICHSIKQELIARSSGFEKFRQVLGQIKYTDSFKSEFENLTVELQKKIIDSFSHIFNKIGNSRIIPDDDKIKDVTPYMEKEIKIFELRIFSPAAIRLYFFAAKDKIYLGSINKKPKPKIQNNDILNALSIIKELIYTEI